MDGYGDGGDSREGPEEEGGHGGGGEQVFRMLLGHERWYGRRAFRLAKFACGLLAGEVVLKVGVG